MTCKNQHTAYFSLRGLPPMPEDVRCYGTQVRQIFLSNRGIIVDVNTTIGVANVSAQNEDGVSIFGNAPKIGYYKRAVAIESFYYEVDLPLYIFWTFGKNQSRHSCGNIENGRILTILTMHPPTDANEQQDLWGYWTSVTKFFITDRLNIIVN